MSLVERTFAGYVFFFCLFHFTVCSDLEKVSHRLNEMLKDVILVKNSTYLDAMQMLWEEYEFDTGAGNRDELEIAKITSYKEPILPEDKKWQYFRIKETGFLATTDRSKLLLYLLDNNTKLTKNVITEDVGDEILSFLIITLKHPDTKIVNNTVAVLYVENSKCSNLKWYKIEDNKIQHFKSWPVLKQNITKMLFIQNQNQNRLLLLNHASSTSKDLYSLIDIYGFEIDFGEDEVNSWQPPRKTIQMGTDMQVCSIYGNPIIGIQTEHAVITYEYVSDLDEKFGEFIEFANITSNNMKNFICFESGYIQYLVTSGSASGIFQFVENEFIYDSDSEKFFNSVTDVYWIKDVKVDTYRKESILLVQFENRTVVALTWHGDGYKVAPLPNDELNQFDLAQATVIPEFGLVVGNQFFKIETRLKDRLRPTFDGIENLNVSRKLIKEIYVKQELIINETMARYEKSYYNNSEVTGNWNLSSVVANNVIVKEDVKYLALATDSQNLSVDEIQQKVTEYVEILDNYKNKLNDIQDNIDSAIKISNDEIIDLMNIDLFDNLTISGTLHVKNLSMGAINGKSIAMYKDLTHNNDRIIKGRKTFPILEIDQLAVYNINNVFHENIDWNSVVEDYSHINFTNINKLNITGNFNFDYINNINWKKLMKDIVWKNKVATISGQTVVNGNVRTNNKSTELYGTLNNIDYPGGYVTEDVSIPIKISKTKSFDEMNVKDLTGIETLNGLDFNLFVNLKTDAKFDLPIKFENAAIIGNLRLENNGTFIGLENVKHSEPLLNETTKLQSDLIFGSLTVVGNISILNSINGTTQENFDDIVLKTDETVMITGKKKFLEEVTIDQIENIKIKSGLINGRHINEFVTTDTQQELRKLVVILADVKIDEIIDENLAELDDIIESYNNNNNNETACRYKNIIFKTPPMVGNLTFNTLNGNINVEHFKKKFTEAIEIVEFDHITVNSLYAKKIEVDIVNNLKTTDLQNRVITRSTLQYLTRNFTIKNAMIGTLNAKYINEIDDMDVYVTFFNEMYNGIKTGLIQIESLNVTGIIHTPVLNDIPLKNFDTMNSIVFVNNVSIENLTILDLLNGRKFNEFVNDAVMKTDEEIVIFGQKNFDSLSCEILETAYINDHSVENALDPDKDQILESLIFENGVTTVLHDFEVEGNINDVNYNDLKKKLISSGNTFHREGHFWMGSDVSIEHLYTDDLIQDLTFPSFLQTVVFLNASNIAISGPKEFRNSVTFEKSLLIKEKLNHMNFKDFHKNVVRIDKPISINANIEFENDLIVEGNIFINKSLKCGSIMNVNITELDENVWKKNIPKSILRPVTIENAIFSMDTTVMKINNVDMNSLILLREEQYLPSAHFNGSYIKVESMDVPHINRFSMRDIYENTFMITGNQNLTGNVTFHGNTICRHNIDAPLINGMNPKKIILTTDERWSGNFVFHDPIEVNGIRVLGRLNGEDPVAWDNLAIKTSYYPPSNKIISGNWRIHGNVHFVRDTDTDRLLNGIKLEDLSDSMERRGLEIESKLAEIEADHKNHCANLNLLKQYAENQIYVFNTFDYIEVIDFEWTINSVHHFELYDSDFLLVNYKNCFLDVFVFDGNRFIHSTNVTNFGIANKWITLKYENEIYFLTIGSPGCGKGSGNIWKIKDKRFHYFANLGNVVDARKLNDMEFLILVDQELIKKTLEDLRIETFYNLRMNVKNMRFVENSEKILFANEYFLYEYDKNLTEFPKWHNNFGTNKILSFQAGVNEKNMFIYWNSKSRSDIYINSDPFKSDIVQTIPAIKPESFTILNFDENFETLIIFSDNQRKLEIYEYKGTSNFIYRDTIKTEAEKLISFKLTKFPFIAKKYCLAVIYKNRLMIMEALMHGEKLQLEPFACPAG